MLGRYSQINSITKSNGVPTYVLTGWNIPDETFMVDICNHCTRLTQDDIGNIDEEEFITSVNTIDDIIKFATEQDLLDRLHFDDCQQLLVGTNHEITVGYTLTFTKTISE